MTWVLKSKDMQTLDHLNIIVKSEETWDLTSILLKNRHIDDERLFFAPDISHLHDPFLMPDMEVWVKRILEAREKWERIIVFGDYDVDGVSGTALLVRFLTEIGCQVSYRLPHRVHDGYGIKSYIFDEIKEKWVSLVITVDCGTRDIEPIRHAKSLGIDVIVTDHHAVPEVIPTEVIALINPKRKDSHYPFPNLAGAWVAFKLLHGILMRMTERWKTTPGETEGDTLSETDEKQYSWWAKANEFVSPSELLYTFGYKSIGEKEKIESSLIKYIDLASLWTVADCMPLIGENRVITTLGLRQMKNSESAGLKKFLENSDHEAEWNADLIWFQIWPRINASGRMDTPITALKWLLASDEKCDEFLTEIEELNTRRQEVVKNFSEKALMEANPDDGVLFYLDENLEHGLIWLVAGKLTEAYNRPAIALCRDHTWNLVASCRSPEWCNLVELLDSCKEYFVRYGGHRQAAGFTIESSKLEDFKKTITQKFREKYGDASLPQKTIEVECRMFPEEMSLQSLDIIDNFKPFGIGNRKPLFLARDITIIESKLLGKEWSHLTLRCEENPDVKFLYWRGREHKSMLEVGNIISLIFELEKNEWNGKKSVQGIIRGIVV